MREEAAPGLSHPMSSNHLECNGLLTNGNTRDIRFGVLLLGPL